VDLHFIPDAEATAEERAAVDAVTGALRVQDNEIVRVTSPLDHDVTNGHLCVKGRFGWQFVQNRPKE
jgi:hypothetical protein